MASSSSTPSSSTPFSASLHQLALEPPSSWSSPHLSTLIASLARDAASRQAFSQALLSTPQLLSNLVSALRTTVEADAEYWVELAQLRAPPRDGAHEDGASRLASSILDADVERRLDICKKAARLMTSGVAGQTRAQEVVFECLKDIRWTLWRLTSFHLGQIKELKPFTRILSQMLSNLITSHPQLQQRLFDSLGLGGRGGEQGTADVINVAQGEASREAGLICRLLSSDDAGTRMGAQMMLLNAIAQSDSRAHALASTPSGAHILFGLLETADALVEQEESEADRELERLEVDSGIGSLLGERMIDREEAASQDEALGMSPVIVQRLLSLGLFGQTWASLAPKRPRHSLEGEAEQLPRLVSPSQVVLLKFLDADLHGPSPCIDRDVEGGAGSEATDLLVLVDVFSHLAKGLIAILGAEKRGSSEEEGRGEESRPADKEAMEERYKRSVVVDAFVALVLVLQGLVWAVVRAEEEQGGAKESARERQLDDIARSVNLEFRRRERRGVEDVVELLALVGELFPSTSPFGPPVTSASAVPAPDAAPREAPQHHVLSSTGSALSDPTPKLQAPTLHVKRSLVQLLAALCFVPPPSSARNLPSGEYEARKTRARDTQDRVRNSNGVTQVLNALQLDERNPYIREHAVFAMRNLLADNAENQAIVASLRAL